MMLRAPSSSLAETATGAVVAAHSAAVAACSTTVTTTTTTTTATAAMTAVHPSPSTASLTAHQHQARRAASSSAARVPHMAIAAQPSSPSASPPHAGAARMHSTRAARGADTTSGRAAVFGSVLERAGSTAKTCSPFASSRGFHTSAAPLAASKDLYATLGVSKTATVSEIKKAYYQLAKKYHPDTNKTDKDAAKKFSEISEAYETLSDETKRQRYDTYGTTGDNQFGGGGSGGFDPNSDIFHHFQDIFRQFEQGGGGGAFGAGTRGGKRRGSDVRIGLEVSFMDAIDGTTKTIDFPTVTACTPCNGTGSSTGKTTRCPSCRGTGMETVSTGMFAMQTTCRKCSGAGQVVQDPCKSCHGQGSVESHRKLDIKIPPGSDHNQSIRVPGAGEAGTKGGATGDLWVVLQVGSHPSLERQGPHIISQVEIGLSQALLGGTVPIQGLRSKFTLTIPPKIADGTMLRMRRLGVKTEDGQGDHLVSVRLKLPRNLTELQKAALIQFAKDEKYTGTVNGVEDASASSTSSSNASSASDNSGKTILDKFKETFFTDKDAKDESDKKATGSG
ncbi:DnaJ protein [Capsaspora owczarzaki ATCC 30864]|uniref:DnaJ protein n=1 Tax=Capsaspora owczarzaki (strain ATCC 30864) TaxID=595528 RepID=A0A0D2WHE3_CAPO3|nr:DnaJ protein [Capsaspora owczarzaki ATCC 30864]KJE89030.1 DnaJ protein [Capsaspora owczarzaki ATCC 30864]|eukprot:XP_004365460.2 DnaJ protein [Capsaspora owczarzaki ATCC 30864]